MSALALADNWERLRRAVDRADSLHADMAELVDVMALLVECTQSLDASPLLVAVRERAVAVMASARGRIERAA